jgi:hypothetical protein
VAAGVQPQVYEVFALFVIGWLLIRWRRQLSAMQ